MVDLVHGIMMMYRMRYLNDKEVRLRLQPTLSTTNLAIEAICWNGNGVDALF